MSWFASAEGLKRKREEYQLTSQRCPDEMQCNRLVRLDGWPGVAECPNRREEVTKRSSAASASTGEVSSPSEREYTAGSASFSFSSTMNEVGTISNQQHQDAFHPSRSGLMVDIPTTATALSPSLSSSTASPSSASPRSTCDEGSLVLTLRPVCIDVVRGDTGRHYSFHLQITFSYVWHYGKRFYKNVGSEQQVSVEVQERATCRVWPTAAAATPSSSTMNSRLLLPHEKAPESVRWASSIAHPYEHRLFHNEEVTASCIPPSALRGDSARASYTYEVTQLSHQGEPPTLPPAPDDALNCLGHSTASILVDCFIKCIQEEASFALNDGHGWVCLYHGRHIATEVGRARLLQDVFARSFVPGSAFAPDKVMPAPAATRISPGESSNGGASSMYVDPDEPSLKICVFRKY